MLFGNNSGKQFPSLRFMLLCFSCPVGFASLCTFQDITTPGSIENEDNLFSAY
jgi:hypothetical protein